MNLASAPVLLLTSPLGDRLEPAAKWSLLAYGILLIAGGVLGYVLPEKPSKASLIAGSITGALAIVAFFLAGSNPRAGFALGLAVAALTGVMMLAVQPWVETLPDSDQRTSTLALTLNVIIGGGLLALGAIMIWSTRKPRPVAPAAVATES